MLKKRGVFGWFFEVEWFPVVDYFGVVFVVVKLLPPPPQEMLGIGRGGGGLGDGVSRPAHHPGHPNQAPHQPQLPYSRSLDINLFFFSQFIHPIFLPSFNLSFFHHSFLLSFFHHSSIHFSFIFHLFISLSHFLFLYSHSSLPIHPRILPHLPLQSSTHPPPPPTFTHPSLPHFLLPASCSRCTSVT